jgi:hypothetical protein
MKITGPEIPQIKPVNIYSLRSKLIVAALVKFFLDTHVFRRISMYRFAHFGKNAATINLDRTE